MTRPIAGRFPGHLRGGTRPGAGSARLPAGTWANPAPGPSGASERRFWRKRGRGLVRLMGGVPVAFASGIEAVAGSGRNGRLPFALGYRLRGRCGVLLPKPCGGAFGKVRR